MVGKLDALSKGCLNGPLKNLDLKFELHNAVYLIETLNDVISFKINGKSLIIEIRNRKK